MPNLVEIGQTAADIWRFLNFSKMAAVRHLGFVVRVFGPSTKGIWWSLSPCKIRLDCLNVSEYMLVLALYAWLPTLAALTDKGPAHREEAAVDGVVRCETNEER